MDAQYQTNITPAVDGNSAKATITQDRRLRVDSVSSSAPVGGGITWGAPTAVAVTAGPASTTLVAANAARKALQIWNPTGNAQMSVDIKGGTAVLATGRPFLAGDYAIYEGAACPVTLVTFIGTAGQSLVYQEGT